MKLLDKIKDLFMDEIAEEDEVELVEEENKEYREPPKDVLPKVMRDTIKREEGNEVLKNENISFSQNEVKKEIKEETKKFNFPIDFTDELPTRNSKPNSNVNVLKVEKEVSKKVSELYPKKEEIRVKPKFKATPVISPVYGILDKNYHKDEVKEKTDDISTMKRPSKKVDFETVRKKAFGNLADEIKDNLMCENCELYREVKKISSLSEDDLLYDMTVDEDEKMTIEKAYDNYEEFGVAYEPNNKGKHENDNDEKDEVEQDKDNIIVDNNNLDKEIDNKDDIPSRSDKQTNNIEKKKEDKVDDDFFDLIDSMYKERTDD